MLNAGDSSIVLVFKGKTLDPVKLANEAAKLKEEDLTACRPNARSVADPFAEVFVVTDVDDFTANQLHEANAVCAENDMCFVVSNPCFEVWLIDHVQVCPETITLTKAAASYAAKLGVTTGNDNKEIVEDKISDNIDQALANADKHMNDPTRRVQREQLQTTNFAPWTDMPELVRIVKGK